MKQFGCIEAGGTKFVCAVASGPETIEATCRIPTTTPEETISRAIAFFRDAAPADGFAAVGIASFGPVVLDRDSPDWGKIAATPKPGWSGVDMAGAFAREFNIPVAFDTDVAAAALAEARWGAAREARAAIYLTVGTGIGGGAVVSGRSVHGRHHAEMGHLVPERHGDDRAFAGSCPFHGGCVEGLASGTAIRARWDAALSELPADHPAHEIVAWYLGGLAANLMAALAPDTIVMGGGVMETPGLIDRVRIAAAEADAGYRAAPDEWSRIIVPPGLGGRSGILGALALAQDLLAEGS